MTPDRILRLGAQAQPHLAHALRADLVQFLQPFAAHLGSLLDIRLLQTALDLVQVILIHRHRLLGLLLSELGGYLLGPDQAPAGTKRISNLFHCPLCCGDDITTLMWQQPTERVQELQQQGKEVLLIWDGCVWEKPESQASQDWCLVRSAKARRLDRRRKGLTLPHKRPPILVPGLHWEELLLTGMQRPPTLVHMHWWTTRTPHATNQRALEQILLERSASAWRQRVRHIFDRGYAGSAWVQAALAAGVGLVVRWKKGNKLLDNWGEERKASAIGASKRSRE